MDATYWTELLSRMVTGRRAILAGGPAATHTATVQQLRELGVGPVLVVATGAGTGPPPDAEIVTIELPPVEGAMSSIRAEIAALQSPPDHVRGALARFDPDRTALVLGSFLNEASHLARRPFLAYRRSEWVALDDKTTVDGLWDRSGVVRTESRVVAATPEALWDATAAMEQGDGTVWAGDSRDGWHGGASLVRHVHAGLETGASEDFVRCCDRVRVMPYLRGVPCSIHGVVISRTQPRASAGRGGEASVDVIALRPVEMVVLPQPDGRFFYCGCSTTYDPPEEVRDEMRRAATAVGHVLAREARFRGAFTIDGVATDEGFRPTELNPRNGAGLNMMARELDGLPFQFLLDAMSTEVPIDWRAHELEALLLDRFDRHRVGGTWARVPNACEPQRATVTVTDQIVTWEPRGGSERAGDPTGGRGATFDVVAGPAVAGEGFVRAQLRSPVPTGPVAPVARLVWEFLDRQWGLGLGELLHPRWVRD